MKQIKLKSISLVNFRGHKDTTITFGDQKVISGGNGTGKSTVMDAFLWLLFGKDQFDRANYEITPIVNGSRLEKVDSEVSAYIEVDNREISLKKVYSQKWVRPKGQSEEVFKGNEVVYFFNDVPKKEGEYKMLIDAFFDETVFKLVTSPKQFLSLHWTKQRDILFTIAGTISDAEILDKIANVNNRDAVISITNMLNSGKALSDFKKEIAVKKKKASDELKDIQPRIDQTTKLMPEAKDFSPIENEIAIVDAKIKTIDEQLSDRSKAIRGIYDTIQGKQKDINDLKTQQTALISRLKAEAVQEANEANAGAVANEADLKTKQASRYNAKSLVDNITSTIAQINRSIEGKTNETNKLRAEWVELNAKEYNAVNDCLVCPVFGTECGDPQATNKHNEAQLKAKDAFYESKNERLDEINASGLALKTEIGNLNRDLEAKKAELLEANTKLAAIDTSIEEAKKAIAAYVPVEPLEIIPSNVLEWVNLNSKITTIEAEIKTIEDGIDNSDNADLTAQKTELNKQRDALKQQLGEKITIGKYEMEIADLKEQGRKLSQEIANLEKQEFAINDFSKVKIDECERRINSLFEIVRFKLFDKTIDGNEFETCIAVNQSGVPIASTNTAEKVNAGLDIIRTISTFYNISAPIFVDRAESVNEFLNIGSQMVFLRVTKDQSLVY